MVMVEDAIAESNISVFVAKALIVTLVPSPVTGIEEEYTEDKGVGSLPSVV